MKKKQPPRMPPGRRGTPPEEPVSWERLREVFASALEVPAGERGAWLAGLEDLDEPLRREVASLLEAHEKAGSFLNPGEIRRLDTLEESVRKSRRRPK
jgi:hypothetical protein